MAAKQVSELLVGIRDTSGEPLASGKVYTYEAGTTTNKTTWTDIDKTTAAANPIILDANGRAQIYAEGNYKLKIDDSNDNTVYTWDDLVYKVLDSDTYYSGDSTGSSNAYAISNDIPISSYSEGQVFTFIPNFDNDGSATINVDSVGTKTIKYPYGDNLIGGEIRQSVPAVIIYDGTDFLLQGLPPDTDGSWSPTITGQGDTISSVSIEYSDYVQFGKLVFITLRANFTTGSTSVSAIEFNAPTNIAIDNQVIPCSGRNATSGATFQATFYARTEATGNKIVAGLSDGSNFGNGINRTVNIFGYYFAA